MAAKTKTLLELGLTANPTYDGPISGLVQDSRRAKKGMLFAALPGSTVHGAVYVKYVVDQGVAAVLTDRDGYEIARPQLASSSFPFIIAEDPRASWAGAAALWYEDQPEHVVAVTGTNGKTSIASFCRQIWTLLGERAVNLGTTGVEGAVQLPLHHTTPDPLTLHHALHEVATAGVSHAAMEASSHGLEQRRLDGVRLTAAGFSNFTQDHLDYHQSFEAYFDAKAGLFRRVLPLDAPAVINIDDPKGAELAKELLATDHPVLTIGRNKSADLALLSQRYADTGQDIRFSFEGDVYRVFLPLIGAFQSENVLLASGLCIASGSDPERVFSCLQDLTTVRGRMEHAATRKNGASVFVDYAHTPDAIKSAINSFRPHVSGRLVALIGAGGDRDATKRPLMGQIAGEHADFVIVSDDNPRSEDPSAIRDAVISGLNPASAFLNVGDRAEAILRGIDMLEPGDGFLIMGKGHESGQIVGDDVLPFDDVEQASVAVVALDGVL